MDGFFSPQKILKICTEAARHQHPIEIRLDEDHHVYIGFLVVDSGLKTGQDASADVLVQEMLQMSSLFLSPVEPSFGNARIQQSPHVYVQFAVGNHIYRCMLKVAGQHPHGHLTLHRLSFPEALLHFSHRKERRNHLTPDTIITAMVRANDHQKVLARVLDVSRHGLAIQYPPGTRLFNKDQALAVDLFAPAAGRLSFQGRLKHYSSVPHMGGESGNFVQCGIEIETGHKKRGKNKRWQEVLGMVSRREKGYNKRKERELLLKTL